MKEEQMEIDALRKNIEELQKYVFILENSLEKSERLILDMQTHILEGINE